jgi:hypothetical protein
LRKVWSRAHARHSRRRSIGFGSAMRPSRLATSGNGDLFCVRLRGSHCFELDRSKSGWLFASGDSDVRPETRSLAFSKFGRQLSIEVRVPLGASGDSGEPPPDPMMQGSQVVPRRQMRFRGESSKASQFPGIPTL